MCWVWRPCPHMHGWVITMMSLLLMFSLSVFLSLTLSFLRGVVQSVTLERYLFLPFLAGRTGPSSEKLTGPVQFPVSSPLSRLNCCALVRKWVSLFGIYCPYCANVKHIQQSSCVDLRSHTHSHTQISSAGLMPRSWVWLKHSHSPALVCGSVTPGTQYIDVIKI